MKKLFRLSQKPQPLEAVPPVATTSALSAAAVGLHPKLNVTLPPVPHPTPYYRIAILATKGALLLRPLIPGVSKPHYHVRIPWGDSFNIEELPGNAEGADEAWGDAAIVFGILGCLKLTSGLSACHW